MKALTVLQPWATCIARHGKDVENRSWVPSGRSLCAGDSLAIHAGARWAPRHGSPFMVGGIAIRPSEVHFGCVVAVVTYGGAVGGLECSSPWADGLGSWCWLLKSVRALAEPVPCRGAQGLWNLPADVEARA